MIDSIIVNIIVYVIFPCIVFAKSCIRKDGVHEVVLTRDDSSALRGIAAAFVMFSHYLTFIEMDVQGGLGPAKLFCWFGGLGVCLFFFLSGYGLWLSTNKGKVSITFLMKRFSTVLPAYFILRLIFGFILGEYKGGILSFVLYVIGLRSPLWFICEILIIYVLMYIATKINKGYRISLMTGMLIAMSLVFFLFGFDARWYNANLVFVMGMLFAKYREKITAFLNRKFWLKGIVLVSLFGVSAGMYVIFDNNILDAFLKLLAGSLFCSIFVMLVMKLKLNSKPIIYLGKKSLYIYIIHISVWTVCNLFVETSGVIQFLLSIVISIASTVICGYVEDWIKDKIEFKIK